MKSKPSKQGIIPRVGHIEYLNCLPLYYGLENNGLLLDVKLIRGKPTELARLLLDNELDLAPIPSIEYGRNYKNLRLLSDISVSSDGEVKSIVLVSKVPLEKLDKKVVSLTTASATSQVLTKLILSLRYKVSPVYHESSQPALEMLKEAEAALFIGDEALDLYYQDLEGLYKYDLGKEWKQFTGHKMVYAVWAVSADFAEANREQTMLLDKSFGKSIAYSKKYLDKVARHESVKSALPEAVLKNYFETLRFDFNAQYQEGLLYYYEAALKQGYLKEMPTLNFC